MRGHRVEQPCCDNYRPDNDFHTGQRSHLQEYQPEVQQAQHQTRKPKAILPTGELLPPRQQVYRHSLPQAWLWQDHHWQERRMEIEDELG